LIPPEGVDLPTPVWRAVAEFRFTLQAGALPDEVADATDGQAVREHFSIPEQVEETAIEAAVETATEAVVAGEVQTATAKLAAVTETVCERESPEATVDDRPVACHRYDEAVDGEPLLGESGR
jgi:peptide/nickel transport system ATP-binding protein